MKLNLLKTFTLCALAIALTGCAHPTSVDAGHESVLVSKPWIFGHGGVDPEAVKTGSTWVAVTTDAVDVNMQPLTFDETFDDIMPKDNNPVDYHANVRLQVTDSVVLITKFGADWYNNNVKKPFQTMNRNQVRQYSMPDLALQQEVVNHVEAELEKQLTEYFRALSLPVKVLNVNIGKVSPQKAIIDAYNDTGVQQQRAKTEAQRKLAEDSRLAAEQSRARADRGYLEQMGFTADQYIRLETLRMCREKQGGCSVFLGATPVPTVSVK